MKSFANLAIVIGLRTSFSGWNRKASNNCSVQVVQGKDCQPRVVLNRN